MTSVSRFRHDPAKSILSMGLDASVDADWRTEPVVSSYCRVSHEHPRTGEVIPVPICSTPAIVSNIGVVIAGYDGVVRFFAPDLAKTYWRLKLPSSIYASVVVDRERRHIIVADTSGRIVSTSLRGEVAWSVSLDGPIYGTPAVCPEQRLLVAACFGGHCAGVDLESGRVTFTASLPKTWFADVAPAVAARDPYASPIALPGGGVLVCSGESVTRLDPTGRAVWSRNLGRCVRSSPATVGDAGTIVVAGVDGSCSFLNSSTGEVLGELKLGDKVTASIAASGAVVVVGVASGRVFGLDVRTRAIAWEYGHGAPIDHTSFTVLPDGAFICTNSHGNIVARACEDGQFLWETSQMLGVADLEPRLDITPIAASSGTMYCASYSGVVFRYAFRRLTGRSRASDHG